jgi:protein-S-isoprenylcysteine O-methyltransferase Ste14
MENQNFTVVIVAILFLIAIDIGSMLWIGQHKLQMDPSWPVILGLIPTTVASLLALVKSFQNGEAIREVHLVVNSRLTELLAKTAETAKLTERAVNASEALPGLITPEGTVIKPL